MKRRSFLKLTAFLGPAAALMPQDVFASKGEIAQKELSADDKKIREIVCHDIGSNTLRMRHDILLNGEQYHVDSALEPGMKAHAAMLKENRNVARELLNNIVLHNNRSWNDVQRLPLPLGVDRAMYVSPVKERNLQLAAESV